MKTIRSFCSWAFLVLPAFLAGVLSFFPLHAQRYQEADALTVEEGLRFRDVTAIAQDESGLLWFGTRQGLDRYDGYRFLPFGNEPGSRNFFPAEDIGESSMTIGLNGRLFILAGHRLYQLDPRTNRTTPFRPDTFSGAAPEGKVATMELSPDGALWLVIRAGRSQSLWRCTTGGECCFIDSRRVIEKGFTSLESNSSGEVWWSTEAEGLRHYGPGGDLRRQVRPDSFLWYGHKLYFTLSYIDSRNRHFLFPKSRNEVWLYDENRRAFLPFLSTPGVVYHALEDRQGGLWFSTRRRLLKVTEEGAVTDFTPTLENTLDYSVIRDLFEDQTGNLWIATDNGLIKLPVKRDLFQHYLREEGKGWGNTVRGFCEDEAGQVIFYAENQGRLYRIPPAGDPMEAFPVTGLEPGPYGTLEHVRYLAAPRGTDAVFMVNDHLLRVGLSDGILTIDSSFADVLEPLAPNPLIALSDGRLLLGYRLDKLTLWDPLTEERKRLLRTEDLPDRPVETKFLLEDRQGNFWVGTLEDGLYRISREGKVEAHYHAGGRPALSKNHVMALAEDPQGYLWVGTFGGGLNRLDPRSGEIRIYTRENGLADDNVTGILPEGDRHLWVSTYNGLSCLDRQNGTFQNYYEKDGLTHNEFNYSSFFRDRKGRFYFGGMNGVNAFHSARIQDGEANPPLVLTRFLRYDRRLDSLFIQDSELNRGQELLISPYTSYFQLEWTLPNYSDPENNQYHTRLEGYEEEWIYQGNNAFLRYNRLPPGRYVLRVKGADPRGNESEEELAIRIRVPPFFYQTWWFITLLALFICGLVFALFQYRLYQYRRIEGMRTRIASDLHDDVGGLLSGLAMQAEIMEMKAPAGKKTELREMSDLSREVISKMRDLVWAIDSRRDSTTDLCERMREYVEETLIPLNISFTFDDEKMPVEKRIPPEVRQHLFLILKEAVTNVARHSGATHVHFRVGNFRDGFEMLIHDNGRNDPKDYKTTGLGLANMRMRAKKIGAVLEVAQAGGFRILLRRRSL